MNNVAVLQNNHAVEYCSAVDKEYRIVLIPEQQSDHLGQYKIQIKIVLRAVDLTSISSF